ncbi:alpha/beta hydrolase family protein [Aurantivibrio plasticivorans]
MKFPVYQNLFLLVCLALIVSCGGGGSSSGGGGGGDVPDDGIALLDSLPAINSVSTMNAPHFALSHLATSGLTYSYSAPCSLTTSRLIIRGTSDIDDTSKNRLVDHLLTCDDDLPADSNQTITLEDSASQTLSLLFRSAASVTPTNERINVVEQEMLPLNSIGNITALTLLEDAVEEADLSPLVEALVNSLLNDIANDELPNLFNPLSEFDVVTQTVLYESIDPRGNVSQELSGLIVFPDTGGLSNFTPKNDIVLLTHSTDLTPSDKSTSGPWYNLAIVLASRGYLVVVPDNYGLGNTSAETETYLQAKRTGINAVDLISSAINSGNYDDVITPSAGAKNVAIAGYSQGGHSAVAAWQEILHNRQGELKTTRLYTGAGPYNVYETVKGVINYANGTCLMDDYCRYVNDELVTAYAVERILPPLLQYADTGLETADVITGTQLTNDFTAGFIGNLSAYNALKALLQLSSYTNITNPGVAFSDSTLDVYFYHSNYDRLVARANSDEFIDSLGGYVQGIYDVSDSCNSSNIQLLYANVSEVGVVHGVCGIIMIDDLLAEFD